MNSINMIGKIVGSNILGGIEIPRMHIMHQVFDILVESTLFLIPTTKTIEVAAVSILANI